MTDRSKLVSAADFLAEIYPPTYIVDPILQRGQLTALTGMTGHGKSAVQHLLCLGVAAPIQIPGLRCKQGRALALYGENADNARLQFRATCLYYGVEPEAIRDRMIVYQYGKAMDEATSDIMRQARGGEWGDIDLVSLDTSAAYFGGDDENSNAQMREHAALQRAMTRLPAHPAVLSNCHPIKAATKDNLIPRGGGAFLNEIDSNLTLWNDGTLITVHHTKLRGPPFEAICFKLVDQELTFADGSKMSVPVAVAVNESEQVNLLTAHGIEEKALIDAMALLPGGTVREWSTACGWLMSDGRPYAVKTMRTMKRLEMQKRVKRLGSRWVLCGRSSD